MMSGRNWPVFNWLISDAVRDMQLWPISDNFHLSTASRPPFPAREPEKVMVLHNESLTVNVGNLINIANAGIKAMMNPV